MKIYDVTGLSERIRQEYGLTQESAQDKAMQVMEMCPVKLTQNVEEWSKRQKLTDIYIGNYSLPMILAIWNSRDFLRALEIMIELEKGNIEIAERKIWNMRR
ncbi:MAG: hypothetical protein LUE92_01895 [Clostridiales bacterium]|nr:hypothetical protein [Clostridiales bacterium]